MIRTEGNVKNKFGNEMRNIKKDERSNNKLTNINMHIIFSMSLNNEIKYYLLRSATSII